MNCKESQLVLEEYLDGELDQGRADIVAQHLGNCMTCTSAANELRAEFAAYQNYNPAIEVPRDLWTGVQARLGADESSHRELAGSRRGRWLGGLFAAPRISVPVTVALVLAAVVITVVIMKRVGPTQPDTVATSKVDPQVAKTSDNAERNVHLDASIKSSEPKPSQERPTQLANRSLRASPVTRNLEPRSPDQLVREAQRKYLTAISMLSREVARHQSQLDPDTRTKLEQALASIDRTIAATRQAVREHPDDPIAVQFMLSAYAKKVDVLREMATVGDF